MKSNEWSVSLISAEEYREKRENQEPKQTRKETKALAFSSLCAIKSTNTATFHSSVKTLFPYQLTLHCLLLQIFLLINAVLAALY